MAGVSAESGSFRDSAGRIFHAGERVLRTVMPAAVEDFEFVRNSGLIDALVSEKKLVGETTVDASVLGSLGAGADRVLEHPRLPFISYPYEWSFSALKSAALLHLDIQQEALKKNVALSDATAYNVQFVSHEPVFIDSLSFRRYEEGEYWAGHRQFCEQFLNPLLLRSIVGIPHNAWYRGELEGISAENLSKALPWHSRLSWNVLTNVFLQARYQNTSNSNEAATRAKLKKLPRIGYEQMLHGLRKWIAGLEIKAAERTVWQDYASDNSYDSAEAEQKRSFIAEFASSVKPALLFDIGCNTGDYSALALENGAKLAIGFDFDTGALDHGFRRAQEESLNFLPLHLDAANPSPGQGWLQQERMGFKERAKGDAVIGLALIHHLVIAKNLPMQDVMTFLVDIAPQGVIEFVPKNDPMVQRLLSLRDDIFADYNQASFEAHLARCARTVKVATVSESGRTLYWFDRG